MVRAGLFAESEASTYTREPESHSPGSYGAMRAMQHLLPHHHAIVLKWKRQEAETSGPSCILTDSEANVRKVKVGKYRRIHGEGMRQSVNGSGASCESKSGFRRPGSTVGLKKKKWQ